MQRWQAVLVGAGVLVLAVPWTLAAQHDRPRSLADTSAAGPASPAPASSPAPAARLSPSPSAASPSPSRIPVVRAASGKLEMVPGGSARSGPGPLHRFSVEVEKGLGVDAAAFAAEVESTLADPRSWGADGRMSFRRVDAGPVDVRVVLASPRTADRLCLPLHTAGIYSCGIGSTAVINSMRWLRGADAYEGHLPEYRQYVINHEVGHTLGHHHEYCAGKGEPAPVMMQQTKGVGACRPVPWPYP